MYDLSKMSAWSVIAFIGSQKESINLKKNQVLIISNR